MNNCMKQEDAMNMSNEQAINILIPLRNMMRDQYGCPISDAYFALDKAIEVLKQTESHWIPCSERFPDKDGDYIVTGNKTRKIWIAKYSTGSCFGVEISAWINDSKNPVIKAWMPLPELYSEQKK